MNNVEDLKQYLMQHLSSIWKMWLDQLQVKFTIYALIYKLSNNTIITKAHAVVLSGKYGKNHWWNKNVL